MTMWQELKPKLEIPSGVLVENEKGINDRYKTVTSLRDIYKIYPNIVTLGYAGVDSDPARRAKNLPLTDDEQTPRTPLTRTQRQPHHHHNLPTHPPQTTQDVESISTPHHDGFSICHGDRLLFHGSAGELRCDV
jgi:hypothetical protein